MPNCVSMTSFVLRKIVQGMWSSTRPKYATPLMTSRPRIAPLHSQHSPQTFTNKIRTASYDYISAVVHPSRPPLYFLMTSKCLRVPNVRSSGDVPMALSSESSIFVFHCPFPSGDFQGDNNTVASVKLAWYAVTPSCGLPPKAGGHFWHTRYEEADHE